MDAKTLEDLANNPAVSDDTVFDALHEYVADKKDSSGNVLPPSASDMADFDRLRDLLRQKRPAVLERLRQLVVSQHRGCCGDTCEDCD